jgi:hypothetical protein
MTALLYRLRYWLARKLCGRVLTQTALLSRIYFEIAAECIGEDEVRKRRDALISQKEEP